MYVRHIHTVDCDLTAFTVCFVSLGGKIGTDPGVLDVDDYNI